MTLQNVNLNLAKSPLRNRRLFFFLCSLLGAATLIFLFFAGEMLFIYKSKVKDLKESSEKIGQRINNIQRSEKKISTSIRNTAEGMKDQVNFINMIIFRKSFSWSHFFYSIEKALPSSSYIISLSPEIFRGSNMEVRLKVVSSGLDVLLQFLNNLKKLNFKSIKLINERKDDRGMLVSEISLSYERNI